MMLKATQDFLDCQAGDKGLSLLDVTCSEGAEMYSSSPSTTTGGEGSPALVRGANSRRVSPRLAVGSDLSIVAKATARKMILMEGLAIPGNRAMAQSRALKKIQKKSDACGIRLSDNEAISFSEFLAAST